MKCKYLVVRTGYTDRLADDSKHYQNFIDQCDECGFKPLFITDSTAIPASDNNTRSIIEDVFGVIEDGVMSVDDCCRIMCDSGLNWGCIVVKVDTVEKATKFCQHLYDTDFCCIYGQDDFRLINVTDSKAEIMSIVMHSESG